MVKPDIKFQFQKYLLTIVIKQKTAYHWPENYFLKNFLLLLFDCTLFFQPEILTPPPRENVFKTNFHKDFIGFIRVLFYSWLSTLHNTIWTFNDPDG